MRALITVTAAALGLAACAGSSESGAADTGTTADTGLTASIPDAMAGDDAGAGADAGTDCTFPSGRRCPSGAVCASDDLCNFCTCSVSGVLMCTAASCADGGTPIPDPCTANTDCPGPYGYCAHDEGCGAPTGHCVRVQNFCARPDTPFCGCDGVTFMAACAGAPYAHAGPCP